jgi:glutamate-1-semialdehyde aminotransferase
LNLFGWSPAFITEAIEAQLKQGMEIGPRLHSLEKLPN